MLLNLLLKEWQRLALFIAFAPIMGTIVEVLVIFVGYSIVGHPYRDIARRELATRIREAVKGSDRVPARIAGQFDRIPDDSLFVWMYYSYAPKHLIEWARRRRQFQYTGTNWSVAASLGIIAGLGTGILETYKLVDPRDLIRGAFIVLVVVWLPGLLYLRTKMKQDADTMELTWVCAQIDPNIVGRAQTVMFPKE